MNFSLMPKTNADKAWRQLMVVVLLFCADFALKYLVEQYFHITFSINLAIGIAIAAWIYFGRLSLPIIVSALFVDNISEFSLLAFNTEVFIDTVAQLILVIIIGERIIGAWLLDDKLDLLTVKKYGLFLLTNIIIFLSLFSSAELIKFAIAEPITIDWLTIFDDAIKACFGDVLLMTLTLFLLNRFDKKLDFRNLNTNDALLPLSTMAVVICLINVAGYFYNHIERTEQLSTIKSELTAQINSKFLLLEQKVRSLSAFFAHSSEVTPNSFNHFAKQAFNRRDNLIGFSWNKVVTQAQLPAYLAELANEYPELTIKHKSLRYPSFSQSEIAVIVDKIYPFDAWKNVIGLDVMTEANRQTTMMTAINTQDMAYTDTISLLQLSGTNEQGVLLFSPCCTDAPYGVESSYPRGFAVGIVNVSALLNDIIEPLIKKQDVLVEVDELSPVAKPLIHVLNQEATAKLFSQAFTIQLKNKHWQGRLYPTDKYWLNNFILIRAGIYLSFFASICGLFSILNGTIRRHQINAKAKSNEEFVSFIGQIEAIVYSTVTNNEELHIVIDVYTSLLEINNHAVFNRDGRLVEDLTLNNFNGNQHLFLDNAVVAKVKAIAESPNEANVVFEKIHRSRLAQSIVLIPWMTKEKISLVIGFIVNSVVIESKYDKLGLLTRALNKVSEIRRHKNTTDELVNHLQKLNELLAEAESLGKVGSFQIDFIQNDFYFSKQLLNDFQITKPALDASRMIWATLPLKEKRKFLLAIKQAQGEKIFTAHFANGLEKKFKVKWHSTHTESQQTILGVVIDVTEQLLVEQKRQNKLARDMLVKNTLYDLTFNIASSSDSLPNKMTAIAQKARALFNVSRASIWFFEENYSEAVCKVLATAQETTAYHAKELVVSGDQLRTYLEVIQKSSVLIISDNIAQHPCTAEMFESYLKPLDIKSMTDFPIIENGMVVGVFSLEQQFEHWAPNQEEMLLGNTITALLANVIEAEEKSQLLNQLLVQQHEREQILSSMVDAVITINKHGIIQSVNKAAIATFEYQEQELIGHNVKKLMLDKDRANHDDYIREYIAGGEAKVIGVGREVEGLTKSGRTVPLRLSVTEIEGYQNSERIFVGVLHDLTLEVEQRRRIIQSEKMDALGLMTGGIAHDFNNILGIMLGYTEMILDSCDDPDSKISKYASQIEVAGDRAKDVIAQIRSVAKSETLEQSVLAPSAVVRGCQPMLEKAIVGSKITLSLGSLVDDVQVKMNKGDFENALLNLCINAMHASQPGQKIRIDVQSYRLSTQDKVKNNVRYNAMLCVSVTDQGIGMSEETQERLFEPFYTTKGEQGTGLGLAQVYGFVQRTKGFVKVQSELGKGSTISLFLPIIQGKVSESNNAGAKAELESTGNNQVVLVAEDETTLRHIITRKLASLGYQVFEASDGAEAIAIVDAHPIDLVLTDVIMPSTDGIELANYVLANHPKTKVQLMSGFSDMRQLDLIDEQLYHDRLTKPFKLRTLIETIQKHFEQ